MRIDPELDAKIQAAYISGEEVLCGVCGVYDLRTALCPHTKDQCEVCCEGVFSIHESHNMQVSNEVYFCLSCHACSCHSKDELLASECLPFIPKPRKK